MSTTTTHVAHPTHDHHDPNLQHYFVNAEQQFDAAKMGIWLFLVTEVLLFSGMFVAYAVFRSWYPEAFHEAFSVLDWRKGFLNTLVLLTSSFTMVRAINSIQNNDVEKMQRYLWATVICGMIFMIVKYFEYAEKYEGGIFFNMWDPHGGHYEHLKGKEFVSIFLKIYFIATGIHGTHVLIGMGILLWCISQSKKGRFDGHYYTHVEVGGLFWHLVDIVWIFLFPLLYLTS
jgi:cytochrome c oxidase subunit 3